MTVVDTEAAAVASLFAALRSQLQGGAGGAATFRQRVEVAGVHVTIQSDLAAGMAGLLWAGARRMRSFLPSAIVSAEG